MTATAHATFDATAASSGRLSSVASGVLEFVWPMYLTLVFTLGAWVLVPTVLLGWQPMTIISGSMSPTIQPGHVVVVEPYDGQEVGPGTVVTFRDAAQDRLVTHRVKAVAEDGTITTKGDANAVDDLDPLTTDRIVGVGRLVVPTAGLPALWVYQGRTDLLAVVGVLTVLATASAAGAASAGVRSVRQRLSLRGGTRRRSRLRTIALGTGAVGLAAVLSLTAVSRAAFVGAEDNPANSFQAGAISPPAGLTATPKCQLIVLNVIPRVELRWQAVSGATAYDIYRSQSADSGYALLTRTSSGWHDDLTVERGRTYHYRIRAVAGTWVSTDSSTASATVSTNLVCT